MTYQSVEVPARTRRALDALSILSRKWHPVVLAVLAHRGATGFNELLEAMPDVSGKVLTDALEALQDAGLVERTVVSESPLRVEYELTAAGRDIEGVFDELAAWSDDHLDAVAPTLLVAEEDRRMTEMYSGWLNDRYSVVRAHNSEQVDAALEDGVDLVLFDRRVPGVEPARVPDVAPDDCRTILLVDDRPDFDVLDIDCDDVLSKPIVRETALEAIERQLSRRGESAEERELAALEAKQSVFEEVCSADELAANERYADLCDRIEALDDEPGD